MIRGSDVEKRPKPVDTPFQTLLAYNGAVRNVVHSHRMTPTERHETKHVTDFDHEYANVQTKSIFRDVSGNLEARNNKDNIIHMNMGVNGLTEAPKKEDNIGWCEACFMPLLLCCSVFAEG